MMMMIIIIMTINAIITMITIITGTMITTIIIIIITTITIIIVILHEWHVPTQQRDLKPPQKQRATGAGAGDTKGSQLRRELDFEVGRQWAARAAARARLHA